MSVIDGTTQSKAVISDFFPKLNVIPLQTTNKSLVGLTVKDIKRLNDKLFLLNKMTSRTNLLCFDTTGKFTLAIDRSGHGPQEYTYLGDFITAPDSSALILMTEKGTYMVVDTAGNYLSTIRQEPPYYYDRQFLRTNDSTCIVFHNGDFPQGSDLLEVDARTFAIRRSVLATDPLASEGARPLSLWNGRLLYCNMNDTIYDVSDIQNRQPVYYFDFGEDQRKAEGEIRRALSEDRNAMLKAFSQAFILGEYTLVTRLFENAQWIAVSGVKQNQSGVQKQTNPIVFFVLYDKESGRSYRSEHISWDALNIGPLENIEIVGCDAEGTLYALWYGTLSEKQKRAVEAAADDRLSPELKAKLLARGEEDNPVLFMLR